MQFSSETVKLMRVSALWSRQCTLFLSECCEIYSNYRVEPLIALSSLGSEVVVCVFSDYRGVSLYDNGFQKEENVLVSYSSTNENNCFIRVILTGRGASARDSEIAA